MIWEILVALGLVLVGRKAWHRWRERRIVLRRLREDEIRKMIREDALYDARCVAFDLRRERECDDDE
jgi:hypothetical protein